MLKRKSKNTTRQSDNKLEIGDGYMSYVYKNKIKKPKGQKPNSWILKKPINQRWKEMYLNNTQNMGNKLAYERSLVYKQNKISNIKARTTQYV